MNFFKKIITIFSTKPKGGKVEEPFSDNDLRIDIDYLRRLSSLERIVEVYNILHGQGADGAPWYEKHKNDYYVIGSFINVMKALEDIGMLDEISIDELLNYHSPDQQKIANTLIDIDYWDRIKDIDNSKTLVKLLGVNPDHKDHSGKILKQLNNEIDGIDVIELLEDHIKKYKDIVEVYTYGAKKLFVLYKLHIRDVKDDYNYEFMNRIKDNIDTSIVPDLKLDILQLKEKIERLKFLNKIGDVNQLDDITTLRHESKSTLVRVICQKNQWYC